MTRPWRSTARSRRRWAPGTRLPPADAGVRPRNRGARRGAACDLGPTAGLTAGVPPDGPRRGLHYLEVLPPKTDLADRTIPCWSATFVYLYTLLIFCLDEGPLARKHPSRRRVAPQGRRIRGGATTDILRRKGSCRRTHRGLIARDPIEHLGHRRASWRPRRTFGRWAASASEPTRSTSMRPSRRRCRRVQRPVLQLPQRGRAGDRRDHRPGAEARREERSGCTPGVWDKSAQGSHEIRGRTLGIIGYGNIGTQLANVAESLGMRVLFYDVADQSRPRECARASALLSSCFATRDVISIHVDGRPGNAGLFGAASVRRDEGGRSLHQRLARHGRR